MNEVAEAINNNKIYNQEVQLFIGYCGWDANELEAEMDEGSWILH